MESIYLIIFQTIISLFIHVTPKEYEKECIKDEPVAITKRDSIYKEIQGIGIKHSDIVFKQAIIETNCGKTGVGKTKNNLFGFRGKNGYIYYKTWKDSVKAYKKWQDKHYRGQDYYEFLDCLWKRSNGVCVRYAGDENYTNKLKKVKI
jgi:hypothetical protein